MPQAKRKPTLASALKSAILRHTPAQRLEMIIAELVAERARLEPDDLHERIYADIAIRKAEADLKLLLSRKRR